VPAGVVVLTALAFLPSLGNGFVNWDDGLNFVENPNYRGLGWPQLRWMFTTFHAGPYQPLSWMTLGADYVLWGMDPRGYHLTSLLFHAATVLAFYFLARRLFCIVAGQSVGQAAPGLCVAAGIAALLFGVHPLRVESVVWATERRDVVSGLFFVLTLLTYLRAQGAGGDARVRRRWLIASLVAYAASLLSKGMGITLPLVLVVLDVYPLRRLGIGGRWFGADARPVWIEKLPYVVLAFAAGVVGVVGQVSVAAVAGLEQYGWERRIGVALYATTFYLYKTVLPVGLSALYPMPRLFRLSDWIYTVCGVVLIAITIVTVRGRRRWPAGLAVWISYLGMLAPVSGLTQMGPQIAADRYTYLPCLGWPLLAGWAVWWLGTRWSAGWIVRVAGGLVVVALAVLTWRQSMVWHDSVSLWEHAGSVYPESHLIHQNWGGALASRGDYTEALKHHQESAVLCPESAGAQSNIGMTLTRLGLPDKAERHLRRAIELDATYATAHYNLGNTLVQLSRLEEAAASYRTALTHRSGLVAAQINLANTLGRLGRTDEAEAQWRDAIAKAPTVASAYGNFTRQLIKQRRYAEAIAVLRQGVTHCPAERRLDLRLAWLLAVSPEPGTRDGAEALRRAERLSRAVRDQDPACLDMLGAACAELGRFQEAIEYATQAVRLARASGKHALARQIAARIRLYQAGRPFRLPGEAD